MTLAAAMAVLALGQGCGLPARPAIQQQYDVFARAYTRNDVGAMLATLTEDFELVSETGAVITLDAYRRILERRRTDGRRVDGYSVRIVKFHAESDRARVESEETSVTGEAKSVHRYADLWRKDGWGWRLRRSRTLEER